MRIPSSWVAVSLVALAVALGGCASSAGPATQTTPRSDGSTTDPATPARPPNLDSALYRLVTADDRSAYAADHGLDYRNGSVRVVVELERGASLPGRDGVDVRGRHENLVKAYVAADRLVDLARHENVSAVRPPAEPRPD